MNGADVLYNLAVRLSFSAVGVGGAIAGVVKAFASIEHAASSADRHVAQAVANMEASFRRMDSAGFNLNMAQKYGSGPSQIRAANNLNNAVDQQIAAMDAQMAAGQAQMAAQQRLAQANTGMGLVAGGAALTGVGLLGASQVKDWLTAAANMEQAMNNVAIATGKASGNMTSLRDTAIETSAKTQFSALDIMNMAQLAATNGLNNRTALNAALPMLAKGAEVAMIERGVGYQNSIPAFVQLAHMAGQYGVDPKTGQPTASAQKRFSDMIDIAARSLLVSGGTPDQLVSAMNYLSPVLHMYGGKNFNFADAIQVTALAENLGLAHGRGGSRLLALFRGIAPTMGTRGGAFTHHNQSLDELLAAAGHGSSFWDKHGQFAGFTNMIEVIMRAQENLVKEYGQGGGMARFAAIFGSAGSVAASTFGNAQALAQWNRIQGLLTGGGIESTNKMQADIAATTASQWRIFQTDLQNLAILLGSALLPAANAVLHVLTGVVGAMVNFGEKHQTLVKVIAVVVALVSAFALIAGPILMVVGALQIFGAVMGVGVAAALGGLVAAALPVILVVAAVVAGITVLVEIITHWNDIAKAFGNAVQTVIGPFEDFARAMGWLKFPTTHTGGNLKYVNPEASTYNKELAKHTGQVQATTTMPGDSTVTLPLPKVEIHMHGMDHQTAHEYTKRVARHVEEHIRKTASKATSHARSYPTLTPNPIGATGTM